MTRDLAENRLAPVEELVRVGETNTVIRRVAIAVLVSLFVLLLAALVIYQTQYADPYVQSVLSLNGDPVRGHAIFQMNCSGCHGLYADGEVGPSLRHISEHRSRISLIHQVISGKTPPMPQFQPNDQEMADLLEYLQSL